jgi:hypothetical protein
VLSDGERQRLADIERDMIDSDPGLADWMTAAHSRRRRAARQSHSGHDLVITVVLVGALVAAALCLGLAVVGTSRQVVPAAGAALVLALVALDRRVRRSHDGEDTDNSEDHGA